MPKKKGGKKAAQAGEDKDKPLKEKGPFVMPSPSGKETSLKLELQTLDQELEVLKHQVEELRNENEWLQTEAEKTRQENEEYEAYMAKKSQKRQSLIVSLSDKNLNDLQRLQKEKDDLLAEFEERKTGLRTMILEKETELAKANKELKELEHYKALRHEQEAEIVMLERTLEDMRFKHEDRLRSLKTRFLKEKRAFEQSSTSTVQSMASGASKEAAKSLHKCTRRVQQENTVLRQELQQLIQMTQDLQRQKRLLEKQHLQLCREQEFAHDLRRLRAARMGIRSAAATTDGYPHQQRDYEDFADHGLPLISPVHSSMNAHRPKHRP